MERKLISIKDAAKMLGVSTLTLRNWDKNGKLPALRHPMNNYRVYNRLTIEELIESMDTKPILHIKPNGFKSKSKKLSVLHLDN